MSDLIDRQAAIDALEKVVELFPWRVPGKRDTYDSYNEAWNDAIGRAEIEIETLPSAQPERKRGRWMPVTNGRGGFECDQCHDYAPSYQSGTEWLSDFCPNCGADMRDEYYE